MTLGGRTHGVLSGGGEMGALMRTVDWSKTGVGPIDLWPQSLRTALSILLETGFPMYIAWGKDFTQFYNDGYRPILGSTKHPAAMGISTRETFAEIWNIIGPMFEGVMRGTPVFVNDFLLPLDRHGFVEECYFIFSYSPIREETGDVGGVLVTVTETTERILGARRLLTLQNLATKTQNAATATEACRVAAAVLAENPADVPFALFYLLDAEGTRATLASTVRLTAETEAAPASLDLAAPGAPWPLAAIGAGATAQTSPCPADLPGLVDEDAPHPKQARVLPIFTVGIERPTGVLVAALSPRLVFDVKYESFLELVAGHVGAAIASATALAEAKLRAEALAEIDRAKTTFFSNVSHEFRTPLTLMLAPIQDLLALPSGSPVERTTVQLLHRNALRLLKLVNTLLEFSRIEAGRVEAIYEPVDLPTLTADLASSFREAIERAGLELVVDCPPSPEPIFVDRDMWEKIVLNLLSNALKFTFEGSIAVRLRTADEQAILQVADTGTGIAGEELPRLFERFHRIEGTRSRSHEGSGIGLALIQDLARLHGGDVRVTSALGKGTTFEVRIPRGIAHLPQARLQTRLQARLHQPSMGLGPDAYVQEALRWVAPSTGLTAPSIPPARATGPTERIIFADDNADMRDYVARLLGERWIVETVGDGAAALAAVRQNPPDLLLCDVMMPGLDGFALIAAIRADAGLRALPIILLSARAGEEESGKGLNAGANDYIGKPFSARDLLVRVAATLATARVAHELRALEQAQREYLSRLFEHAPVGIAVLRGPDHVFEVVNSQYELLVPGHAVLERPIREALPELSGQGIYELLDRVYESGEPFLGRAIRLLIESASRNPEERFFDFAYQPIPGVNGKTESILVVVFEVTELARARRDAEAANRAKDEFFAILGHELRNPLAPITTALQLMRLRDDGAMAKERLIIERQVAQITRLVEDLLDVSRITRGKVELDREPVELSEVVAKAVEMTSPLLEERRHHLDINVPAKGLVVDADVLRLTQVVTNLLTNAAKFTRAGGHVSVSAEKKDKCVSLRVVDDGIGIAPDMLPRVFEPFAQEEQTLDRAHGGLGLGLTVVANLVKIHGGTVAASSAGREQGATFTIDLPLSDAPATVAPAPVAPRHGHLGGSRVLVVDDNQDAAAMLSEALEMLGCEVRTAHDGTEALGVATEFNPRLALIDIGLPVMDGYELARRLRASGGAQMRLVAVTGYGQESDRIRSAEAGFDAHLVKPVSLVAVSALIERFRDGD